MGKLCGYVGKNNFDDVYVIIKILYKLLFKYLKIF